MKWKHFFVIQISFLEAYQINRRVKDVSNFSEKNKNVATIVTKLLNEIIALFYFNFHHYVLFIYYILIFMYYEGVYNEC